MLQLQSYRQELHCLCSPRNVNVTKALQPTIARDGDRIAQAEESMGVAWQPSLALAMSSASTRARKHKHSKPDYQHVPRHRHRDNMVLQHMSVYEQWPSRYGPRNSR